MKYRELIDALAIATHTPTAQIEKVLTAYSALLIARLKIGDTVTHTNLAVFYPGRRTARIGTNPRNQAPILIRARKQVKARFARSAHDKIN